MCEGCLENHDCRDWKCHSCKAELKENSREYCCRSTNCENFVCSLCKATCDNCNYFSCKGKCIEKHNYRCVRCSGCFKVIDRDYTNSCFLCLDRFCSQCYINCNCKYCKDNSRWGHSEMYCKKQCFPIHKKQLEKVN